MRKILLIDQVPRIRETLQQSLSRAGHQVLVVANGEEGLGAIRKYRPQLVIFNSTVLKMDGIERFRYLYPTIDHPHSILVVYKYYSEEDGTRVDVIIDFVDRIEELSKAFGAPLLISESELDKTLRDDLYYIRFIDRIRIQRKSRTASVYEMFAADAEETRKSKVRDLILFEDAVSYFHFRQIPEAETLFRKYLETHSEDQMAHIYLDRCKNFSEHGQYSGIEEDLQKVVWNEDLVTDVEKIDQQHRELFNRMNQLLDAVRQDLGKRIIVEVIRFLEAYTVTHFGDEERLMQQYNYPRYSQHKAAHTQFIEELDLLKEKKYEQRMESLHLVLRIRDNLVDWFTNHIHKEDKKLALFLKEQ